MTTYSLSIHMNPVIEMDYDEEIVMDNGPVASVVGSYEFAHPGEANANAVALRGDLRAAGHVTEPGFAHMQGVLSFALVGGGYAVLNPA